MRVLLLGWCFSAAPSNFHHVSWHLLWVGAERHVWMYHPAGAGLLLCALSWTDIYIDYIYFHITEKIIIWTGWNDPLSPPVNSWFPSNVTPCCSKVKAAEASQNSRTSVLITTDCAQVRLEEVMISCLLYVSCWNTEVQITMNLLLFFPALTALLGLGNPHTFLTFHWVFAPYCIYII